MDELLSLDERIESGEVSDLNEFFGFKAEHKSTIKKRIEKKESYSKVHMALINHRLIGGNFSTSGEVTDGLREVADVTNTPVRIVQEIYNENKDKLLELPRNSSKDEHHGVAYLPFPLKQFRLRGRATFED